MLLELLNFGTPDVYLRLDCRAVKEVLANTYTDSLVHLGTMLNTAEFS